MMKKGFYRTVRHILRTKIKLLLLLITLSLTITACGKLWNVTGNSEPTALPTPTPVMVQKLRITNQGSFTIQHLIVRFPKDRVDFGDVLPGATTDYQDVPHGIYRYAAYEFEVDGQQYQEPNVDWIGEITMSGKAYTYILEADPSRWETEGQVIRLVQVIEDP